MDESQLRKVEAIINSMTPQERRNPSLINGSRRKAHRPGKRDDGPGCQSAGETIPSNPGANEKARGFGQRQEEIHERFHVLLSVMTIPALRRVEICKGGGAMAVRIRLRRMGAKKRPFYRLVVADSPQPAGWPLHRKPRLLQSHQRACRDSNRRREGPGLAAQGGPTLRHRTQTPLSRWALWRSSKRKRAGRNWVEPPWRCSK